VCSDLCPLLSLSPGGLVCSSNLSVSPPRILPPSTRPLPYFFYPNTHSLSHSLVPSLPHSLTYTLNTLLPLQRSETISAFAEIDKMRKELQGKDSELRAVEHHRGTYDSTALQSTVQNRTEQNSTEQYCTVQSRAVQHRIVQSKAVLSITALYGAD
jgi:hypothetical protein